RLDERGVAVRLCSEAVVNVAYHETEGTLGSEENEGVQEGNRVRAARNAYEEIVSRIEEPADHGLPQRGGQARRRRSRSCPGTGHRRDSTPAVVTPPGGQPRRTRPRTSRASRWERSA